MADKKLGVWMVGGCGNVATTAILGLVGLQKQLAPTTGLVTELREFAALPLVPWGDLVVGGHDIREPNLRATAGRLANEQVVPRELVEACSSELEQIDASIKPGIAYKAGKAIRALADVPVDDDATTAPRELISRLQNDLKTFIEANDLRGLVVMNVASTEPPLEAELPDRWEAFDELLNQPGADIPASTLYAVAALELGLPFVNFTPSAGANFSAVEELTKRKKICHAGHDGKTGETLMKTVLAPLFAERNLEVLSWVGHNIFGNLDGRILDNPENRAAKVATKDRVVGGTLGYDPQTLVSIEYIESLGDWKTAWDHIHFRGFLGTLMTLQFTWQGCDSALAAPLVLDLVRLADVASRAGNVGALTPLAAFFKHPLGTDCHHFAKQHARLLDWVRVTSEQMAC
ncbi:inositol-3-phosphate synthase [Aeoliella sp. ICT_H6.2]|uniref:Inositol-3-phosphate synthase n=1 Tax=Aeoliella straminimaris TaxID=2954799 RepID=A0A9X2FB72_9BACT|nr:inositol-3-phosphate synthase [Aeoliella straminimaris]MCO6045767.1 inositol-3-phosphate synthase [Aeoliella straminimaris]